LSRISLPDPGTRSPDSRLSAAEAMGQFGPNYSRTRACRACSSTPGGSQAGLRACEGGGGGGGLASRRPPASSCDGCSAVAAGPCLTVRPPAVAAGGRRSGSRATTPSGSPRPRRPGRTAALPATPWARRRRRRRRPTAPRRRRRSALSSSRSRTARRWRTSSRSGTSMLRRVRQWSLCGQSRRATGRLGCIGPAFCYAIGGTAQLALRGLRRRRRRRRAARLSRLWNAGRMDRLADGPGPTRGERTAPSRDLREPGRRKQSDPLDSELTCARRPKQWHGPGFIHV
jgi:hypothetical protein